MADAGPHAPTPANKAAHAAATTGALLIIGAEVLSGKVADANGPFLLAALRARGVEVVEMRTIGDSVQAIGTAVAQLAAEVDHVITTGGIGPTHDDVTMEGVATAFATEVICHPELLAAVTQHYVAGGTDAAALPVAYRRLAEVPQGADVLLGDSRCIPVVQMRNVTILPGVPALMRAAFSRVAPRFAGRAFVTCALYLIANESFIAAALADVQAQFADVAIGSYPRFDRNKLEVRLTIDGRDAARVEKACRALEKALPQASRIDPSLPP